MIQRLVDFFGEPRFKESRKRLFFIVLALTVVADFLVHREHAEHFWEAMPGWGAFYGFIACFLIIFVSKFLGHQCKFMRREDYYD